LRNFLKQAWGAIRNLTPRHWGWLHFKLAMIYWASVMMRFPPDAVADSLKEPYIFIWTAMTMFGGLVSMVGLFMSAQPATNRFHVVGVSIELAGLCLFIIGPIVYWTTQLSIFVTNQDHLPLMERLHTRYAVICLAYAMTAAIVARILVVFPRFRRYSKRPDPSRHFPDAN
jgi:peptidoglycan biosynthesis protein MviN/MurJ (putative lipid II flippase)